MTSWTDVLSYARVAIAAGLLAFGVLAPMMAGRAAAQAREITMTDAERIALEHVPGTVESIERDRDGGAAVFEVEVRDAQGVEHEVVIDAASGRVLRVEQDE
jgi:uncharacterized membrane protein YkoI